MFLKHFQIIIKNFKESRKLCKTNICNISIIKINIILLEKYKGILIPDMYEFPVLHCHLKYELLFDLNYVCIINIVGHFKVI